MDLFSAVTKTFSKIAKPFVYTAIGFANVGIFALNVLAIAVGQNPAGLPFIDPNGTSKKKVDNKEPEGLSKSVVDKMEQGKSKHSEDQKPSSKMKPLSFSQLKAGIDKGRQ